jgi:uncharacterized membrane protein YbhN (UPF0104 family)
MQMCNACMLYLVFRAMGIPAEPWQVVLIFTAVNLSRYVSFTPGALGIPEGFGGAVSASMGIPFSLAYLAITAGRVLDLGLAFLVIPFFFPTRDSKDVADNAVSA